jgi:molybdopterin molybdotransferase
VDAGAANPESLSFAEARARVLAAVKPLAAERVPLGECRGRALRRALRAMESLPGFTNSSMDGYAVRSADLAAASETAPVTLPVVEVLPAGRVASRALRANEAMRIMTGAMIPDGADAVVPVEDVLRTGLDTPAEAARFRAPARDGLNIRAAGLDLAAGSVAFEAGRTLTAYDLGLAAALGETHLEVGTRPRVVVLSTGNELLEPGEPMRPGAIRDSNRLMLTLLLEDCGCVVARANRVPDDPGKVSEAIVKALDVADVVLTIGGVSAGDFDPVKQSLAGIGEIALWRVALRPGRPQAFGTPKGRLFFGLPGNPASVACTFEVLVRPALRKLMGHASIDRHRIPVRAAEPIASKTGRTDFVRVTLAWREGAWWASPAGDQVSGHLTPQSRAHALLEVPAEREALAEGDEVSALLLRWPEDAPA